jgi:hypothetical protein
MNPRAKIRFDASAVVLILSNVFTMVLALLEQWSLSDVMWIYWGQSVIIGVFNFARISCLKEFSTEGVKLNDQPVPPTKATQHQIAWFFAAHYGIFHAIYFVFLCVERADVSKSDIAGIAVCVAVFGVCHAFSFWHNREEDSRRKPNIGTVMMFPYARIIPMHFTILLGSLFAKRSPVTLILFLSLKTLADLIMHMVEHRDESQPTGPTGALQEE